MRVKKMWLIIFAVSILLAIAAAVYLAGKVRAAGIFDAVRSVALSRILSLLLVAAVAVVICLVLDVTNMIVIAVHFALFMLAGDLIRVILNIPFKGKIEPCAVDLASFIVCVVYLSVGWFLMHGLWETDYALTTDKQAGNIRIAHIADTHIGCGFDGKGFGERLQKVQEAEPDILVITGDFVDDSSMKEDMVDACAALGRFRTKYGIYFCFGNHDSGYYASERRGYNGDELVSELEKNGVTVLQDENVLIDDRFYVIGRRDADYGRSDRMSAADLVSGLDKDRYMIVLDHQPTDYEAEADAGIDLVLSGHTHGGQLWPLEYIQPLISENDNVRGYERIKGTDFIVTDGFSDWAVKFRTGCRSEFNIIDIR